MAFDARPQDYREAGLRTDYGNRGALPNLVALDIEMRCQCEECGGDGTITCPECDGEGFQSGDIQNITIRRSVEHYDELIELQCDAKRVIEQAERLKIIKPHRSASYEAQLKATLFVINEQADKLVKTPLTPNPKL